MTRAVNGYRTPPISVLVNWSLLKYSCGATVTEWNRYRRMYLPSYIPFTRWSKHEANVFNIHVHDVCS